MSNQYPSYHNYSNQQQAQPQDNMNHSQPPQYQMQVLSHQFHAPSNLLPVQPMMQHRQHISSSFPSNGPAPGTAAFVTSPTGNPFSIPQGVPPQSMQQNYVLPLPASIISNVKNNPPSHPDTSPTRKRLQSRLQVPASSPHPQQTPKKKRGRPPKPDSLAQKITTTLNINVNTSPLNCTPAESNSNLMVKQGAPDIFTPLMRVSPSSKSQRRKRKLSTSSNGSNQSSYSPTTNNISPTMKKSRPANPNSNQSQKQIAYNYSINHNKNQHLVTPLSTSEETRFLNPESSYQINYKTLDNMSMITQSQGYYNTPPPTSTKRNFSTPHANQQQQHLDKLPDSNIPTPLSHNKQTNNLRGSPPLAKINEIRHESKNLLPPVSLTSHSLMNERNNNNNNNETITKNILSEQEITAQNNVTCESLSSSDDRANINSTSRKPSDDFLFRLTIDELGKAVLSSDIFAPIASGDKHEMQQQEEITSEKNEQLVDDFSTVLTHSKVPPVLPHTKSVIGIESMHNNEVKSKAPLRRHNSDITNFSSSKDPVPQILAPINEASNNNPPSNFNNPQTPRETYGYISTGLTPLFNLTPQFNSLMYSVMNLNASPAYKKANNPFLINQELFTSGDNAAIVQRGQHLEELAEHPRLEKLHEKSNAVMMEDLVEEKNPNNTTMDTHDNDALVGATQDITGHGNYLLASSSEDSGDARQALKKIIHVKRK